MPYILIIWMANTNPVTIATYPTEDSCKIAGHETVRNYKGVFFNNTPPTWTCTPFPSEHSHN